MASIEILHRPGAFRHVVVVTGHMTDAPHRSTPRFPETEVPRVRGEVADLFAKWQLGRDDLVICGAARGGDLIVASAARARHSVVWAFLARSPAEFAQDSVAGSDPAWVNEYWDLLQRTPSWQLDQVDAAAHGDGVYVATNDWMLDVADRQATGEHGLRLVAIWDGTDDGGRGGAADMVRQARLRGAHVTVIDPRPR